MLSAKRVVKYCCNGVFTLAKTETMELGSMIITKVGAYVAGGACMAGGRAWRGGMRGGGAHVAGGRRDGHCSGWYAADGTHPTGMHSRFRTCLH